MINQYAERNGIEIIKWFGDEGISAKDVRNRTDMVEMLQYCSRNKGRIGYALFYNMKRASRDAPSFYSDIKPVFNGLGIRIRSATEYIDETPAGQFMEGMFVLNGQLDNGLKGVTTEDNMKGVARQGWWQHGHLFGYEFERVKVGSRKKHTTLVRNTDAPIVADLFKAFSEGGLTQADIKRMAQERGLRNYKGKFPDDNAINRMLTQPAYAGYICSKHTDFEMYEGKHINEAIIDLETFNRVQLLLSSSSRSRIKVKKQKTNELYPLKGSALCFNCHKLLRASGPRTGGGKSYSHRYHCPRSSCKGKVPSLSAEKANLLFAELLKDLQPSDATLRLYKEILNKTAMKQLDSVNQRLGVLRQGLSDLDKERSVAMRKWNMGSMSDLDKDELIIDIENDKAEKRIRIEELEEQQSVKQAQIDYAMNFMSDVYKLWIDADVAMRQRFQKVIFPEGVILDTASLSFGTLKISPLYRYAPNKKDLSVKEKSLVVRFYAEVRTDFRENP